MARIGAALSQGLPWIISMDASETDVWCLELGSGDAKCVKFVSKAPDRSRFVFDIIDCAYVAAVTQGILSLVFLFHQKIKGVIGRL
jgi:hypothetical protein